MFSLPVTVERGIGKKRGFFLAMETFHVEFILTFVLHFLVFYLSEL